MTFNRILILGSTLITQKVVELLRNHYDLVGYVPSSKPTIGGSIDLPVTTIDQECDIKISVQYDKILKNVTNCFNLHTGLLPQYGGTNILSYTLENKEKEQGLTFHKMSEKVDYGPIISKITYPVLPDDSVETLYRRQMFLAPSFALSSLKILEGMCDGQLNSCLTHKPTLYKRGEFEIPENLKRVK
jgi:hypothetical protein